LIVSCAGNVKSERVFNTSHFKIFYTTLDDANFKEIADSLENGYPKITTQLQSGELSTVNVHFSGPSQVINLIVGIFKKWQDGKYNQLCIEKM